MKNDPQFIGLTDAELKDNKAFFPRLVNYIYNNYIGELLNNKNHKPAKYKDIKLLDNLFDIYTELVFSYKWNNRPLIVEFSLFTGINKNTFYTWLNNSVDNNISESAGGKAGKELTYQRSDTVAKWVNTCERALVDGTDTIKDIFILKAKHGWRDANNDIQITVNHKPLISADELPRLIDINGNN